MDDQMNLPLVMPLELIIPLLLLASSNTGLGLFLTPDPIWNSMPQNISYVIRLYPFVCLL